MTNQFATQYPYNYPINGCFIVENIITDSNKTIYIFNYPIPVGTTRDLLRIPGVSEESIRAALLKGILRNKLFAKEIRVICSDIDLLQFNTAQKHFLQVGGVVDGLEVTGSGSGITAAEHQTLRQLIHFIDSGGPGDGFASGAVREILPAGNPFPTSVTWYLDPGKTQKLVEKFITYNSNEMPIVITHNMYDFDGVTIIHTVTDAITYVNNAFETTRTRTIA